LALGECIDGIPEETREAIYRRMFWAQAQHVRLAQLIRAMVPVSVATHGLAVPGDQLIEGIHRPTQATVGKLFGTHPEVGAMLAVAFPQALRLESQFFCELAGALANTNGGIRILHGISFASN
jgi:hypothetical protein